MLKRLASVQKKSWRAAGELPLDKLGKDMTLIDYQKAFSRILNDRQDTPRQLKHATDLLCKMTENKSILPDFKSTAVLNKIFLKDDSGKYSDLYVEKLRQQNLEPAYFQIERCLERGQYEQAVELFWSKYDQYTEDNELDMFRLMKSLRAFKILMMASDRDDTDQLLKLITVLGGMGYLTQMNYSGILSNAIRYRNYDVCLTTINSLDTSLELSQGYLISLFYIFVSNDELVMALRILTRIDSQDTRSTLCLEVISRFELEDSWTLLDSLAEVSNLDYSLLPSSFLQISGLDDFEVLDAHLQCSLKLKNREAQKIMIYSLLSSIDNNQGHFASTAFVISFLKRHQLLDLLDQIDVDVVFHNISKYGNKVAAFGVAQLVKEAGLNMSTRNYYHLMKCECFGTEHDGVFRAAIDCLEENGKLEPDSIGLIKRLLKEANDTIAERFLDNLSNVDSVKAIVDYNFLCRNFQSTAERQKYKHDIMKGFGTYNSEFDQQNLRKLRL
ncbi:DEKNAAC100337 [Brettanomyces naardenensis]|uniref:DEKNAAC100337 n=1 Tax=Brettanomyces naardenensis TaxID=13370 RepID=A0A448YET7_BRENA|nr:DEKNAAC100337 [Brettanomyces naardenensis]